METRDVQGHSPAKPPAPKKARVAVPEVSTSTPLQKTKDTAVAGPSSSTALRRSSRAAAQLGKGKLVSQEPEGSDHADGSGDEWEQPVNSEEDESDVVEITKPASVPRKKKGAPKSNKQIASKGTNLDLLFLFLSDFTRSIRQARSHCKDHEIHSRYELSHHSSTRKLRSW